MPENHARGTGTILRRPICGNVLLPEQAWGTSANKRKKIRGEVHQVAARGDPVLRLEPRLLD
jgi:hypothetical protein